MTSPLEVGLLDHHTSSSYEDSCCFVWGYSFCSCCTFPSLFLFPVAPSSSPPLSIDEPQLSSCRHGRRRTLHPERDPVLQAALMLGEYREGAVREYPCPPSVDQPQTACEPAFTWAEPSRAEPIRICFAVKMCNSPYNSTSIELHILNSRLTLLLDILFDSTH